MQKQSGMLKITVIVFFFFCTSFCHAQDLSQHLAQALNSAHPLVQKALNQEATWRVQCDYEIKKVLNTIKKCAQNRDFIALQQHILDTIKKDLIITQKFTENIRTYNGNETIQIPVKSHKIIEILDGTQKLIQKYGQELLNGIIPQGYAYNALYPPLLGDAHNALGTSKATFLKTALLYCLCALKNCKNFYSLFSSSWYDSSSLVMPYSVPHDMVLDSTWSFFISDKSTPNGIFIPHSGYAYGGHRTEPRYPKDKLYGTQDCSSWISKLLELDTYITTRDLLYVYRIQTGESKNVPTRWKTSSQAKTLLKHLIACPITTPADIQEGMIFCLCTFSEKDTLHTGIPLAGHVALCIHHSYNNKLVTLGYNRDMPLKEGFGIELFDQIPDHKQKYMFFTKN